MVEVNLEKLGLTQEQFDALSEEEQKTLIEGASLPAQKEEEEPVDKQIKGLLSDLKKERDRRAIAEEKVNELEERLEELEAHIEDLKASGEEPSPEEEEEVASIGKVKKLLEETLAEREEEYNQRIAILEAEILADRLKASEDAAQEKYSPEKVGAELCYDKVINEGFAEMLMKNPAYRGVVVNSPNPAEEAYKIGLTHPDFQAILKTKTAAGVVEKLTAPKVKTGVGSSQGASGFDASKASISDLLKLSDEELKKLAGKT
jgi:uncharacterized small protein (DUF1192 family)